METLRLEGAHRAAIAQHRDPLHQPGYILEPVTDVDDADALLREVAYEAEQALRLAMAQRRRWLVKDQDTRL